MNLFAPRQRVVITDPVAIPDIRGRCGVVEATLGTDVLVDTSRGEAVIVRMDDPAPVPGLTFRYLMLYAAECSPLEPSPF
jgi:hypothetical protein